jgi:hypothetical protein
MLPISVVIEGSSDEGIAEAILRRCGARSAVILGRRGKSDVLKRLPNFNATAVHMPWFVLVDLDHDYSCPVTARQAWLPSASAMMCFRIAVREIEAWLLADFEAAAGFLAVPLSRMPADPESLDDPKQTLINLARKSRKRQVRDGLVPRQGSSASVGPTYVSDVRDFAREQWRPEIAAANAPSLDRCLTRLAALVEHLGA